MKTSVTERIKVSNAMQNLINLCDGRGNLETIDDDLKKIINFGSKIKSSSNKMNETIKLNNSSDVTGYTPEAGDVSITTEKKDFQVTSNHNTERVGHFKMRRTKGMVYFWQWKSAFFKESLIKGPKEYVIAYNEDSKELIAFGEIIEKEVFQLSLLNFLVALLIRSVNLLYGKTDLQISNSRTWVVGKLK